jgi:antirestriction protein ArdC
MAKNPSDLVYKIITERILKLLEAGTVPWHKPWSLRVDGKHVVPMNLISKIPYRGVNILTLTMAGYSNPYWVTYRQALERGGRVKSGEHGLPVVFFKMLDRSDASEPSDQGGKFPLLRYYTIFNVDQCEGLEFPKIETTSHNPIESIEDCEDLVANMQSRPEIKSSEARAYYMPSTDIVNMPNKSLFESAEEYYSTLFHELVHSTGHQSRVNRKTLIDMCRFGDTNYSKEELVAEMGATFLCGIAGIENKTIDNSAAYLASWIKKLQQDPRLLVQAGSAAQKAVDYILGVKAVKAPEMVAEPAST